MAYLFDTHMHISTIEDPAAFFENARVAGCRFFLMAGTSRKDAEQIMELCNPEAGIYAAIGQYPECWEEYTPDLCAYYRQCYEKPGVVAVGEIGLEYHYDEDHHEEQKKQFSEFLDIAAEIGKPPMIHCRDAFDDCYALMQEHFMTDKPFIIHSFTGTPAQAEKWLDRGGYLSCNGMTTFKNAHDIRESLRYIPMDRLLLETDTPYLAPVPFRGKPNSSAYLPYIAAKVAEVKNLSVDEVGKQTTRNAFEVFGIERTGNKAGIKLK